LEQVRHPSGRLVMRRLTHDAGLRGILLYRIAKRLSELRVPLFPNIVSQFNVALNGLAIDVQARLGYGVVLPHPVGIVIGSRVTVENDVWIFSGVVLGGTGSRTREDGHPYIEEGVSIGAGAKVLGQIRIGARSRIGANAVVLFDVPPDSVVVGSIARIVQQETGLESRGKPAEAPD